MGGRKGEYVYVLAGESSDFHCALINQLLGGGWSRVGTLSSDSVLL
jgi:hypothetical protein